MKIQKKAERRKKFLKQSGISVDSGHSPEQIDSDTPLDLDAASDYSSEVSPAQSEPETESVQNGAGDGSTKRNTLFSDSPRMPTLPCTPSTHSMPGTPNAPPPRHLPSSPSSPTFLIQ